MYGRYSFEFSIFNPKTTKLNLTDPEYAKIANKALQQAHINTFRATTAEEKAHWEKVSEYWAKVIKDNNLGNLIVAKSKSFNP